MVLLKKSRFRFNVVFLRPMIGNRSPNPLQTLFPKKLALSSEKNMVTLKQLFQEYVKRQL